ncbi:MAG: HAD hydrolase family protein, partial [bacterium]|nr:HAD hydrolase family protein [bacterium]
ALMASRLEEIDFIKLQARGNQTPHKLSYTMSPGKDRLAKVNHVLTRNRFLYTLIYSHGKYLDLLPYRASKGKALRYLSYKWGIPLKNFLVCGDSGNDEEMLRGDTCAVVVKNHSPELERLKSAKKVFFSEKSFAAGILDGINQYHFF